MKEQQKILEAQLANMATTMSPQQLTSPDILNALKAIQQGEGLGKEVTVKQVGTAAPVFTAPTAVPEHIANPGRK